MKKLIYSIAAVAILASAGFMIYQALNTSLVYFILPNEYANDPNNYKNKRLRLGGLVEDGSVDFNTNELKLYFKISDSINSYPVTHTGAPPELFKENTGVVVEGRFQDGVFVSDNLLIKHTEVYESPKDGKVDVEALKESLE